MPKIDLTSFIDKRQAPVGDKIKAATESITEMRDKLSSIINKCKEEKRARTDEEKRETEYLADSIKMLERELNDLESIEKEKINGSRSKGPSSVQTRSGTFNIYNRTNVSEGRNDELSLGQWIRVIGTKEARNEVEERALSISTDSAGGYLAPENLSSTFLYGLTNYSSVISAGANVVDLDGPGKSWAFTRETTIPTVSWYGENDTISDSDPAFDVTMFEPKKGAFKFAASNETLQDALNGQQVLETICLRAAAQGIDAVALNGTGTSNQPMGILNYTGINEVDFTDLAPSNYDKISDARYEIVLDKGDEPTSLILHPRVYKDYMQLKATDNQPLMMPKFMEKLRWFESQALSITESPGTNSSAIMGDFRNLWIGMRLRPTVFVDPYSQGAKDQVVFRLTFRMDVLATRAENFCKLTNIGA